MYCNFTFKVKHQLQLEFICAIQDQGQYGYMREIKCITINLFDFTLLTLHRLLYNTLNECVQENDLFDLLPIGENVHSCLVVNNDKGKKSFILEWLGGEGCNSRAGRRKRLAEVQLRAEGTTSITYFNELLVSYKIRIFIRICIVIHVV